MTIVFYDVLHVFGAILLFIGLGGLGGLALVDVAPEAKKKARMLFVIFHGVGLLVLLVAGFGAIAKLGTGFPPWVFVKIGIWLFFGASLTLFKRVPHMAKIWLMLLPALGLAAAYLGNYKPF